MLVTASVSWIVYGTDTTIKKKKKLEHEAIEYPDVKRPGHKI